VAFLPSSLGLGRLSYPFSNVSRDRFIRATNSAEGTVPIPGRRCTDRSTLAGRAHPNTGNSRGARCHPPIHKILPITRLSSCKAPTRVAVVSLVAIVLSQYFGNLTLRIVKGMVMGIKGLISPSPQPQPPQQQQQQPGPNAPPYTRQVPGQASPGPMMISPPITPMSSGGSSMSSGMGGPMPPGAFDPMSSGTPTPTSPGLNQQFYSPTSPTGPGIQDPNAQYFSSPPFPAPHTPKQNSTPGQKSNTMSMVMNPQMNSTSGGGIQSSRSDPDFDPRAHADPNQDPTATSIRYPDPNQFRGQDQNAGGSIPVQTRAQISIQVTTPTGNNAGGYGNGDWNSSDPDDFTSKRSASTSPGPPTTCRLGGCNKPVLVDSSTRRPSEYCSQKHRE
jgi:hypothetical protein